MKEDMKSFFGGIVIIVMGLALILSQSIPGWAIDVVILEVIPINGAIVGAGLILFGSIGLLSTAKSIINYIKLKKVRARAAEEKKNTQVQSPAKAAPTTQLQKAQPQASVSPAKRAEDRVNQQVKARVAVAHAACMGGEQDEAARSPGMQAYDRLVTELEELYKKYPDNTFLAKHLADACGEYIHWCFGLEEACRFEIYRKRNRCAQRALELEQRHNLPRDDKRRYNLIMQAVYGGYRAAGDVDEMQEALRWVRNAGDYQVPDSGQKNRDIGSASLSAVRAWLCYLLAKEYLTRKEHIREATDLANEALLRCPGNMIRHCDLNPDAPQDTTVYLQLEEIALLIDKCRIYIERGC